MHGRSRSRRRPRGDGTRGPRSSSKGKQWLSIQRISLGSAAALISNVSILPSIVLLCFVVALAGAASFSSHEFGMQHTFGGTTVPLAAVSVPTPALQSCGWLHFDFDSTLGFPGEGPPIFAVRCGALVLAGLGFGSSARIPCPGDGAEHCGAPQHHQSKGCGRWIRSPAPA